MAFYEGGKIVSAGMDKKIATSNVKVSLQPGSVTNSAVTGNNRLKISPPKPEYQEKKVLDGNNTQRVGFLYHKTDKDIDNSLLIMSGHIQKYTFGS